MESVGAKLVDDIVYCDAFDFTYSSKSPNVTGLIYVARCVRPCQLIDNPEKVHGILAYNWFNELLTKSTRFLFQL